MHSGNSQVKGHSNQGGPLRHMHAANPVFDVGQEWLAAYFTLSVKKNGNTIVALQVSFGT